MTVVEAEISAPRAPLVGVRADTAVAVLREAKRRWETGRWRWITCMGHDGRNGYCLAGGVSCVPASTEDARVNAAAALHAVLGRAYSIPEWNDRPERTLGDVLMLIEDAIEWVEKEGATA